MLQSNAITKESTAVGERRSRSSHRQTRVTRNRQCKHAGLNPKMLLNVVLDKLVDLAEKQRVQAVRPVTGRWRKTLQEGAQTEPIKHQYQIARTLGVQLHAW